MPNYGKLPLMVQKPDRFFHRGGGALDRLKVPRKYVQSVWPFPYNREEGFGCTVNIVW